MLKITAIGNLTNDVELKIEAIAKRIQTVDEELKAGAAA